MLAEAMAVTTLNRPRGRPLPDVKAKTAFDPKQTSASMPAKFPFRQNKAHWVGLGQAARVLRERISPTSVRSKATTIARPVTSNSAVANGLSRPSGGGNSLLAVGRSVVERPVNAATTPAPPFAHVPISSVQNQR